jgi:stage V sporulation protein B
MNIYGESINSANIGADAIHTFLYGAYDTTLDFRNLIPTIMMTLGVSAIPIISGAKAKNDKKTVNDTVNTVFRTTMLIALPAGMGFFALSEPILSLLYNGTENQSGIAIAAPVLALYGLMMAILTLSSPLTNMLQAIGRADVPMKAVGFAAVAKVVVNFILVGIPGMNILGAIVGTFCFYIITVSYNLNALIKETGVKLSYKSVFFKPLLCALMCGTGAWAVSGICRKFMPAFEFGSRISSSTVSAVIGIIAAVVIYVLALLFTKSIVRDDVKMLPKGEKICKVLEKYDLIG